MRVRILETNDRLGVKEGEIYKAQRYWLDPQCKVTLLGREPDGYDPGCNQYTSEVAFWVNGEWMILNGSKFEKEKP